MNKEINEKNITVFSDTTGRVLIGEFVEFGDKVTKIKNPQIVNAQQIKDQKTGEPRMAINFIPYTYLEIFDSTQDDVWVFPTNQLTYSETKVSEQSVTLYSRVVEAYQNMRSKMTADVDSDGCEDNVIKLVD